MQKEIVKGDGCLRFLAHLYYCITGVLRPSCISSLVRTWGWISSISDFNFFDEFVDFSLQKLLRFLRPLLPGLKNSRLETPGFFRTFAVRAH